MKEFFGLQYSPWTEKARWALDHHQLPYRYHEHFMIFGVPRLRMKLRRLRGGVTVPALVEKGTDGTVRLMDSWEIALHADRSGTGKKLFPKSSLEAIRRYNEMSESALEAGRGLITIRIRHDPEALSSALPPLIPERLRPALVFLGRIGVAYLDHEFGLKSRDASRDVEVLRQALISLRKGLEGGGGRYLLGEFTYADITMAVILQFVNPVSDLFKRLAPPLRRCLRTDSLAREFPDLLEWRDRLYRDHRF